jgi:nanoRNase/pAp phosphatase (c-di-AMP/oligoRNAs hydrolase)
MTAFDVFNGDADGVCALHQLRLAEPRDAVLVTGIKRDIELLKRVQAGSGDQVTVLDISLDRNRDALLKLLERGARVHYFDHHAAHHIPERAALYAVIDQSPGVCTSMLVDRHLGGRYRPWAVVAAFGDNLAGPALSLGQALGYAPAQLEQLRELGESLNYNAYGESESDLLIAPADLYRLMHRYADPFTFAICEPIVAQLGREQRSDLDAALALQPLRQSGTCSVYLLPDEAWSRRVSGAFANHLASVHAQVACAVLTPNRMRGYAVSLRVPESSSITAADFCVRYGGGGRVLAAGIDHLEATHLDAFLNAFGQTYGAAP